MDVDYEAWAMDMCTLLDRVEVAADGSEEAIHALKEIRKLCRSRFNVARRHGLTVEFSGEIGSGMEH